MGYEGGVRPMATLLLVVQVITQWLLLAIMDEVPFGSTDNRTCCQKSLVTSGLLSSIQTVGLILLNPLATSLWCQQTMLLGSNRTFLGIVRNTS